MEAIHHGLVQSCCKLQTFRNIAFKSRDETYDVFKVVKLRDFDVNLLCALSECNRR